MHEVVDAGEEQPLAAAQAADDRMVERAAVQLVAVDRRRRGRSIRRWLWSIFATSWSRPAAGGPGTPGTTVGASAGQRSAAARAAARTSPALRGGDVADRLGDVPVALAAGQRERRLRERLDDAAQGRRRSPRAAAIVRSAVPSPDRRRTSRRTLRNWPSSMPRQAATMSGAAGSSSSIQAGTVIGGRSPSSAPPAGRAAATSRRSRPPARARASRTRSAMSSRHPDRARRRRGSPPR